MSHSKKRVGAFAACLTAVAVLAAGGCSSSAAPSSAGSAPAGPVTITFWSWTGNAAKVAAAFEQSHPNIHIQFTQIPSGGAGGYAKITNALKAGNGPDVFNCEYDMVPEFAAQGALADQSAEFTAAVKGELASAAVSNVTLGGKQYAFPFDIEPLVLAYRKDLFTKYGIAVPSTWAQFQTEAAKAKAKGLDLANFDPTDPANLEALAWQAGANWFSTTDGSSWTVSVADAATQKVASYWTGVYSQGGVADLAISSPLLSQEIANGKILGEIEGASAVSGLVTANPQESGDWAVALLPTWDGTASTGAYGGSALAVNAHSSSAKQSAAEQFAQWYATAPAALSAKLGTDGPSIYPADKTNSALAQSIFTKNYGTYFGRQNFYPVFAQAAASIPSTWTWGPLTSDLNAVLNSHLKSVLTGGSVTAALAPSQAQVIADLGSAGFHAAGSS